MIIDLHLHSYPKSDDSFMPVNDLIDESKKNGLDAVCLTDHDTFWPIEETRNLSKLHNFLVLPGTEINTDNGHVLVFGITEYLFGMHKINFLSDKVKNSKGAMVAAHPYRRRYLKNLNDSEYRQNSLEKACKDELFDLCDCIEVLNGRGTDEENDFSVEIARELKMASTGGSDAHKIEQIGTYATEITAKVNELEDLITALQSGNVKPVCLS